LERKNLASKQPKMIYPKENRKTARARP